MPPKSELGWYVAAIALVAILGAMNLPFPFSSDQAVALGGAQALANGNTLYVDYWDNKMPGLFWFYQLGGTLFGFSEVGVHSIELLWMLTFAVVLIVALRRQLAIAWMSALVPIALLGSYYASADTFLLTQLEIIVALPIFGSLWFAHETVRTRENQTRNALLSGLFAGITVVFKLIFAPLFIAFWTIAFWHKWRRQEQSLKEIALRNMLPVAAAVIAVLGVVCLVFWRASALEQLLWTAFIYPGEALRSSAPAKFERLASSAMFYLAYFVAWLPFVAIAIRRWWRSEGECFTAMCIAWLFMSLFLIYIQRFSWWPYHLLMLFAPTSILGVQGLSQFVHAIIESSALNRADSMKIGSLIAIPFVAILAIPASQKITIYEHVFLTQPGDIASFQNTVRAEYADIRESTAFLRKRGALPGKIYVFGTALYYHLSGRQQALPIGGGYWNFFLDSQWQALPEQFSQTRPNYIYVEDRFAGMVKTRPGGVWDYISERYIVLFRDKRGTWYVAKSDSWEY